jgi:endoribonuclease Dicer
LLTSLAFRYSNPPKEMIIPVAPVLHSDLALKVTKEVKIMIEQFRNFLNNHTYDPAEALGYDPKTYEEFRKQEKAEAAAAAAAEGEILEEDEVDSLAEELKKIPNPRTEPLQVLQEFESILDLLGPWCANRALFLLNNHVMNLKVKSLRQDFTSLTTNYTCLVSYLYSDPSSLRSSLRPPRSPPHTLRLDSGDLQRGL